MSTFVLRYPLALEEDGTYRILTDDILAPACTVVGRRRPHRDDVRSTRIDLSLAVVLVCLLELEGAEKDTLLLRLDWRLRDARAP